jgi:hypothetical protein
MDRFVPLRHHSGEMSRHLRVVPEVSEEEAVYVVARSQHVRPGTPFVLARCVDRVVASVFALAGQQVRTHDQMVRDASLQAALKAWDSGDHSLFQQERSARAAFSGTGRREALREVRWHPSRAHIAQP